MANPTGKKKRGRPKYEPTQDERTIVRASAMVGTPQENIARLLNIDRNTLMKYYREELDTGLDLANAKVAGKLFQQCMEGNTTALIFWLKTRAGWREKDRSEENQRDINITIEGLESAKS